MEARCSSLVGGSCVSCTVDIVVTETLPSIHSNLGPIRHHALCSVCRLNVHCSGPCHGDTHVIKSAVNGCRPRKSDSVCSSLMMVTRSFGGKRILISKRNGFKSVRKSKTTTVHCARTHLAGFARRMYLISLSGGIVSFNPGFSRARGRPLILPVHIPGLLVGNTRKVTINVTADVPARGLYRIISTIGTCVGGSGVAAGRLVGCVGKPSFPAKKVIIGGSSLPTVCRDKRKGVGLHKGIRIRSLGNNGGRLIVARVPCAVVKTKVKGFLGSIYGLIRSGGAASVISVSGRSSGRKVHVIVRLGHNTSIRGLGGVLCGGAHLRSAFNMGVLTITGNEPRALDLGRVVRRRISFRFRLTAEGCAALLNGRQRGDRIRRNLVGTYSIVSLVVRVLQKDGSMGSTHTYLMGNRARGVGFGSTVSGGVTTVLHFARHRTATVLRVHLCHLVNLRVRTLRGRRRGALRGVTHCRSVLGGCSSVTNIVVRRLSDCGGRFKEGHHAIIRGTRRTIFRRGGVRRRRIIFLVSHFNCTGAISAKICREGGRTTSGRGGCVIRYVGVKGLYLFASRNGVRRIGILSLPRKGFESGKVPVSGMDGCSDDRRRVIVVYRRRRLHRSGLLFTATRKVVGHIRKDRFRMSGHAVTTAGLRRRSELITIGIIARCRGIILRAGGKCFLEFLSTSIPRGGGTTINIEKVGLRGGSRLRRICLFRRKARAGVACKRGAISLGHLGLTGQSKAKAGDH